MIRNVASMLAVSAVYRHFFWVNLILHESFHKCYGRWSEGIFFGFRCHTYPEFFMTFLHILQAQ